MAGLGDVFAVQIDLETLAASAAVTLGQNPTSRDDDATAYVSMAGTRDGWEIHGWVRQPVWYDDPPGSGLNWTFIIRDTYTYTFYSLTFGYVADSLVRTVVNPDPDNPATDWSQEASFDPSQWWFAAANDHYCGPFGKTVQFAELTTAHGIGILDITSGGTASLTETDAPNLTSLGLQVAREGADFGGNGDEWGISHIPYRDVHYTGVFNPEAGRIMDLWVVGTQIMGGPPRIRRFFT